MRGTMETLSAATARYVQLRHDAHEFADTTARTARQVLDRFCRILGPRKRVRSLTRTDIETFLHARQGRSAGTVRVELSAVRAFCRWAAREGLLADDPTAGLRGPRPPRPIPRHLDADEVDALLAAAPDERATLILRLMVDMGLRRCEVARLELADIRDDVAVVRGKASIERVLPLPGTVRAALAAYLARHPAVAGPLVRSYVHPGRGLTPHTIGDLVTRLMRQVGVKAHGFDGRSPHALRHTAACGLVDRGVDLRFVQEILGHARLSTTSVYLRRRVALAELRQALDPGCESEDSRPPPEPEEPAA